MLAAHRRGMRNSEGKWSSAARAEPWACPGTGGSHMVLAAACMDRKGNTDGGKSGEHAIRVRAVGRRARALFTCTRAEKRPFLARSRLGFTLSDDSARARQRSSWW